jgi:hypothetical protein
VTLEEFLIAQRDEDAEPNKDVQDVGVTIEVRETASPRLVSNLTKLQRLGLLNGDALLSIVGQAPLDPLNLAGVIMDRQPAGWTFSAPDCSMFRVLARDEKDAVSAAIRVDLLDNSVDTLVANKARQLTVYKHYEPEGKSVLEDIQKMCDEAVQAAAREALS